MKTEKRDVAAAHVVSAVLDELQQRGGFDAWWEPIDRVTRAEIETSLRATVAEALDEVLSE